MDYLGRVLREAVNAHKFQHVEIVAIELRKRIKLNLHTSYHGSKVVEASNVNIYGVVSLLRIDIN